MKITTEVDGVKKTEYECIQDLLDDEQYELFVEKILSEYRAGQIVSKENLGKVLGILFDAIKNLENEIKEKK